MAASKSSARVKKAAAKAGTTKASDHGIRKTLLFGKKSNPKTIVVMFHGQGDNTAGCSKGWADVWAAGLPGALVVVPEAPDHTLYDEGKTSGNLGYDWLRQSGSHDFHDKEASIRKIQRVAKNRMRTVGIWLDSLLRNYGLSNKDLILTGFSQGNNVACLVGAQRRVKAVLLCGGPCLENVYSASYRAKDFVGRPIWPRWEDLMPKAAPGTKFCLVNGTADYCVPRKIVNNMFADFDTTFRWETGLQHHHLFYKRYRDVMLRWMQAIETLSL